MRIGLSLFLTVGAAVCLAAPPIEEARSLYQKTRYEAALRLLEPVKQKDADIEALAGKSYYMLEDFKKASEAFERAVDAAPSSSEYHHWLGRAFGRRAETSSFLTAPRYASRARQYFEKAVQLNSRNIEAMNDLFEYYLQAPGFLGGGVDKAEKLAARIGELDAVEFHYVQARLAEKRKEFATAEQQLRRAAELAPREVGRLIDLARFLAQRGKIQESDAIFQQAGKVAPQSPKVLFAKAQAYIEAGRNLKTARELLERYLAANLTPEDPSRLEAKRLLKKIPGA